MASTSEITHEIQRRIKKRHLLILSLISTCIFLFILCLGLLSALVLVGKHIQHSADDPVSSLIERIVDDKSFTSKNPTSSVSVNSVDREIERKMSSKVLNHLKFRLPRAIKPIHYDLFLAPNLKTHEFNGRVRINITVDEPMPVIALHANKLNITSTNLMQVLPDGTHKNVGIASTFPYEKFEYFCIEPEKMLDVGNYEIKMNFDGRLDKRIVGFYSSTYFDEKKNEHR